jgi:cyclopropane-fatty-acyl-phospholipid synthase
MLTFFEELGVDMEASDMSFAVSLAEGRGCEWASSSLAGFFAQKRNVLNPFFWNMVREIIKFEKDSLR